MIMITENQFNDFASRIFLRFDKMDEKMDRHYQQLRLMIDHVGTELVEFKDEMKISNANNEVRFTSIEKRITIDPELLKRLDERP